MIFLWYYWCQAVASLCLWDVGVEGPPCEDDLPGFLLQGAHSRADRAGTQERVKPTCNLLDARWSGWNHCCKFVFQIREFENRFKFVNFGQIRVFGQIREFGAKFANLDLQIREIWDFMGTMFKPIILTWAKIAFFHSYKTTNMSWTSNIRQIATLDIFSMVFVQFLKIL